LAILTKISTAFENSISEYLHFQPLVVTENGGASCPAGNAELISVSSSHRLSGGAREVRSVFMGLIRS
jgi:hypothetical protein